jgi:chloramphenicol-sensitive protein RarD
MGLCFLYTYAVNSNQVIESSLGYFINPIVNILIGVYFLKEKLSKVHIIASVCAAIGVCIIAIDQRHIPVIALILAITFSLYGLIKKINPLPSLQSNQFESFFFSIPALPFIITDSDQWITNENQISTVLFLIGSGLITGLPLLFFSEAAKKSPIT